MAASSQHINGHACILFISQHLKVGFLCVKVPPQVLITLAEFFFKAPLENHTKPENESQISTTPLLLTPNADLNACKVCTEHITDVLHMQSAFTQEYLKGSYGYPITRDNCYLCQ